MRSTDLLLSGIMGSVVKCVKPIQFPGLDGSDFYAVSTGDGGRVVGVVDTDFEIEILVALDSEPDDYQSFGYSSFKRHFSVNKACRKFRRVL